MIGTKALAGWQTSEFHSSSRPSDENLIEAIATGSQAAMRTLYGRHHVRVFRFIARLVCDAGRAEDLVSEVFLTVWREAGTFENRSRVSTWILSIARFKALNADRNAQLRSCIAQMSPEHREVIDLVYYHEKSVEEVAEIIHLPKNTVKTRMFYARKGLARMLSTHRDFDHLQVVQAA
jgi:RNA polymerase sigma-70 factor (ECF subfamily)